MDPHRRQSNLETCSVDDLYDRLAAILARVRPDRLPAFKEYLRYEIEQEGIDTDDTAKGRRLR